MDSPIDLFLPAWRSMSLLVSIRESFHYRSIGKRRQSSAKRNAKRRHQYQSLAGPHKGRRLKFQGDRRRLSAPWPYRFKEATVLSPGLAP